MSTKSILITGATGKQGGAVLRALASHPSSPRYTLLALTRNPDSASAKKLSDKYSNVKLIKGDLNDVPAVFAEAQKWLKEAGKPDNIYGVYSVQTSAGPGTSLDTEVQQGKALVDEALKYNVQHFIYSSVDRGGNVKSWDNETPIPHFKSKYEIEHHLRNQAGAKGEKMNWTILRPVAFMDNLVPGFPSKIFLAVLRDTLQDKPLQWVSTTDIGTFAAKAFHEPGAWNARAEGLAGDELTYDQLSKVFEKVLGYPAPATFGIFGSMLKWGMTEMRLMLNWFKSDGYGADIKKLRAEESSLADFETWLRERSDWKK